MADFIYPSSDWQRARQLMAVLGSFWTETYQGRDQLQALTQGRVLLGEQTANDLLELFSAMGRETVPVFHRDNWYALYLHESECNGQATVRRYGDGTTYGGGTVYGQPPAAADFTFAVPEGLADVNVLVNRFLGPSLVWQKGIDFTLDAENHTITFRNNPFADNRITTRDVYDGSQVVDREAALWLFNGDFDQDTIYRQFGYVLQLKLKSSTGYRELMNAVFDAIVGGTSRRDIERAFAAITGVPLVVEPTETVEHVVTDVNNLLVCTDRNCYKFPKAVLATVSVGDVVHAGDQLTDALRFYYFNRGQLPVDLYALAVGKGMLANCFYGDLIFPNQDVPLTVEESVDGFTKVSFPLGGFPLDVAAFFDEIHRRGVAAATLVANECDHTGTEIQYPGSYGAAAACDTDCTCDFDTGCGINYVCENDGCGCDGDCGCDGECPLDNAPTCNKECPLDGAPTCTGECPLDGVPTCTGECPEDNKCPGDDTVCATCDAECPGDGLCPLDGAPTCTGECPLDGAPSCNQECPGDNLCPGDSYECTICDDECPEDNKCPLDGVPTCTLECPVNGAPSCTKECPEDDKCPGDDTVCATCDAECPGDDDCPLDGIPSCTLECPLDGAPVCNTECPLDGAASCNNECPGDDLCPKDGIKTEVPMQQSCACNNDGCGVDCTCDKDLYGCGTDYGCLQDLCQEPVLTNAVWRLPGTLAHHLDMRVTKIGEPTAGSLPYTINPMKFLIENILRNNAFAVHVKAWGIGQNATGLHTMRILQRLIPPRTAMLVIVEMTPQEERVTLDMVDDTQIGRFTAAEALREEILPSQISDGRMSARSISTTCQ